MTDGLKKRVRRLGLVEALQTQNRRLKTVLADDSDGFSIWDLDGVIPLHGRLEGVEETRSDHADRFEMFVIEEGSQGAPDRPMLVRQ